MTVYHVYSQPSHCLTIQYHPHGFEGQIGYDSLQNYMIVSAPTEYTVNPPTA